MKNPVIKNKNEKLKRIYSPRQKIYAGVFLLAFAAIYFYFIRSFIVPIASLIAGIVLIAETFYESKKN